MKNKTLLLLMILSIIILGCDNKPESEIISEVLPTIKGSGKFLITGNEIINKEHIVRIYIADLTYHSNPRMFGYQVRAIVIGNTSSAVLGSSATATSFKVFRGQYDECIIVYNQIIDLLEEPN